MNGPRDFISPYEFRDEICRKEACFGAPDRPVQPLTTAAQARPQRNLRLGQPRPAAASAERTVRSAPLGSSLIRSPRRTAAFATHELFRVIKTGNDLNFCGGVRFVSDPVNFVQSRTHLLYDVPRRKTCALHSKFFSLTFLSLVFSS